MTKERINDLSDLKRDAVTRAREMQKKARHDHSDKKPQHHIEPCHPQNHYHDFSQDIIVCKDKKEPARKGKSFKGLFSSLKLDEETILILALIILLVKEKADISIIIALLYLLL